MSERRLRAWGMAALLALAAEVLLLGSLLPLDDWVWRAALFARGCSTDVTVERVVRVAGLVTAALLAAVALLHARRHGVARTWPPLVAVAVGALANDVLKQVFTRERPSNLADVVIGHGFPSGHVMNTAMAGLAVVVLARGLRRPLPWRLAALTLIGVVAAGRVLAGDHWLLDAVGAVLAAGALTGLGVPAFARRPLVAPAALALLLVALLGIRFWWGSPVVRLPSPLTIAGADVVDVHLGGASPVSLAGDWESGGYEEPAGAHTWLRGAGAASVMETSWVDPATGTPRPRRTDGPGELLALTLRPDSSEASCIRVRVAVNETIVAGFIPFRGWREYRLPLPRGSFRPGYNDLQLAARSEDGTPRRIAVARLRLRLH